VAVQLLGPQTATWIGGNLDSWVVAATG
jgi:hypothetical protein